MNWLAVGGADVAFVALEMHWTWVTLRVTVVTWNEVTLLHLE